MQITYPSITRDCLIAILRGERHEVTVLPGTPFAYLKRGELLDWEIPPQPEFHGPELQLMFRTIGLDIERLQAYIEKYCAQVRNEDGEVLN